MVTSPLVKLEGLVKAVEEKSFKTADGTEIKMKTAYVDQENCVTLAEVQIKPFDTKILKGDIFSELVEVRIMKGMKGAYRIGFVSNYPLQLAKKK